MGEAKDNVGVDAYGGGEIGAGGDVRRLRWP